jgi:VanZ family protein
MLKKNFFSLLVAIIILYLSLASSSSFDKVPLFEIPYLDKLVHFVMYFGLMLVIIYENRKSIKSKRQLMLISAIPLIYGIVLEILQALMTNTRSGSIFDAIADGAGIFAAVLIGSVYLQRKKSDIY